MFNNLTVLKDEDKFYIGKCLVVSIMETVPGLIILECSNGNFLHYDNLEDENKLHIKNLHPEKFL